MIRLSWNKALLVLCSLASGCTEAEAVGAQTSSGRSAPVPSAAAVNQPSTSSAPTPAPQPAPAEQRTRVPMELLSLTLTSGVEKKEPVDKLKEAAPGTRVYAHMKVRNRSEETRQVHVDFLVNGKLRTPLRLDVAPSWSYRTWGYNTLQASDTGELEVRIYDDAGGELRTVRLPIRSK